MKLLATIRPENVDPEAPAFDYAAFTPRTAGRAIVFDEDKVALLHVSSHGYYMLPGGGVQDEDVPVALAREVMEEIGCEIVIEKEVGSIEIYNDRWSRKQTDLCYTARKTSGVNPTALTELEKSEGFETVWASSLDG